MNRIAYGAVVAVLASVGCTTSTSSGNKEVCGNGILEGSEECDDGNTTSGDGCSAFCTSEVAPPQCGDGHIDSGETCDDGNTVSGDGCSATCQTETFNTTVTWSLQTVAGAAVPCPTGIDTAAVYSQKLDTTGNPVGSPVIDLFNCAAGTGTTSALPPAQYQTWVALTDTNNTTQYAVSLSEFVDLTTGNKAISVQILNDGGYFSMTWNLVGETSGSALTCTQAGAAGGVEAISTDVANSNNFKSDIFTCTDGAGLTAGLVAGTYTISVDALNASMQSIGTAPAIANTDILTLNRVTDLGTVTIPITGL
jgi:cysteine-rich repeat protein